MSRHAQIEELSDSESDPDDMDPSDFDPSTIISPANISTQSRPQQQQQQQRQIPAQPPPQAIPQQMRGPPQPDREKLKTWQCLYPVYFDATRSRAEGRRVGKELAVPNPLALEIYQAILATTNLKPAFDPNIMHPKDWANPGRVKVALKESAGGKVKNKHHLYILVANYLKANPTTTETPRRLRIQGMSSDKPLLPPSVPRGWKMGTILPMHSPAVSGGGVSENMFKEMMQEMQGMQGAGGPMAQIDAGAGGAGGGSAAAGDNKKKEKKKAKK